MATTPRLGRRHQIGAHDVRLAGVLGEADHRDLVAGGKPFHRRPEGGAQLGEDRRRGDRVAKVLGEEADHLPADLEVRHIRVQVDAVQALKVQGHMAVEHVVDIAHPRHHGTPNMRTGSDPPRLRWR
jgi:hypothetical protein